MIYVHQITADEPAHQDVQHVAEHIRQVDRDELWTLGRNSPHRAISRSIAISRDAYVAYDAEEPVAVFGLACQALGGHGVPWLLGTDRVELHARELIALGRKFIAHALETCHTLENMALAENRATVSFVKRLGFSVQPCKGPAGEHGAVRLTLER